MHIQVVQGQPVQSHVLVELKPPNYVVMSVITMLFFCFIFGLIALLLSLQVGGEGWRDTGCVCVYSISCGYRGSPDHGGCYLLDCYSYQTLALFQLSRP